VWSHYLLQGNTTCAPTTKNPKRNVLKCFVRTFLCEAWGWLSDIAKTCRPYSVLTIIYWRVVLDGYTHLNIWISLLKICKSNESYKMFLYQDLKISYHFQYSLFRGKQWDQQTGVVLLPPGMQTERTASVSHLLAAKHTKHLIHCTKWTNEFINALC
jgi:hypothetical protein